MRNKTRKNKILYKNLNKYTKNRRYEMHNNKNNKYIESYKYGGAYPLRTNKRRQRGL